MNKLLSVEFMYGMNTYYALVRFKQVQDWKEYFISIMDRQLEEFVGKEIFLMEKDGKVLNHHGQSGESKKILSSIFQAIKQRLNEDSPDLQNFNSSQA